MFFLATLRAAGRPGSMTGRRGMDRLDDVGGPEVRQPPLARGRVSRVQVRLHIAVHWPRARGAA
eukprot:14730013-Heterocapsa_arctica.AAC.1